MAERQDLVSAYFDYWRTENDKFFWAWNRVEETIRQAPELGWSVLMQLIHGAPGEDALLYIGAGPLEEFMCRYGESQIERILVTAQANQRFRKALSGVWGRNRIPEHIQRRIASVLGRER
jgi:hypothetical protein